MKMLPSHSMSNAVYLSRRYFIDKSNFSNREIAVSDFLNLLLGKLTCWRKNARSAFTASFFIHIRSIFFCSPYKQVIGSNTKWIITFMAHIESLWDFSIMQLIGISMSITSMAIAAAKHPISSVCTSGPQPTSFSLFNFWPKQKLIHSTHNFISRRTNWQTT